MNDDHASVSRTALRMPTTPKRIPLDGIPETPESVETPVTINDTDHTPTQYKKKIVRTSSGKPPAIGRKISHILDPADQVLFDMKERGETNVAIVEALKRFDVVYDKKTVGTRYLRIKDAISKAANKPDAGGRIWKSEEVSSISLVTLNT